MKFIEFTDLDRIYINIIKMTKILVLVILGIRLKEINF
jgi:hypothetical protein